MITKAVKLWLGSGPRVVIPVSQFDTMWQFVFTIIKDSVTWTIPSGASAVLNGLKPDGNVFAFSGTISGNAVTVDADVQMTAVAGDTICELSILYDGLTVGTANFVLAVEAAPKSPNDVSSDSTLPAYAEMLEMFSGDIEDEVDSWLNAHSSQIGGLTNEAKQALLTLLAHVAYTDDQGQTYLDALEAALYPPADLVSISAVFNQGSAVIYSTDSLEDLRQYLTVTATYSDSTTEVVTAYTLSGTLAVGTSTITATYGEQTDTFDVVVSAYSRLPAGYQEVEWVGVQNSSTTPTAYIDLGSSAIPNTAVLYMEVKPFSILGQYDSPAGYSGSFEIYYTNNGQGMKAYGGTTSNFSYTIGSEWDSFSIKQTNKASGLNLLTYRSDNYAFNGKMKVARITNSGGTIVHDYVPCYRTSDDAIGVYDIVDDMFYGNSGTGTLVKGNNV